jgi:NADH-quinone oxidoreductase subunit K
MVFLAVNLNFIVFSVFLDDLFGQIFALYVIAIAGAEAAVGLALLICFYRLRNVIALDYISTLKG